MPLADTNGISLYYDTFGSEAAPCLLLVTGLGEQMTAWPRAFCQMMADSGFFVVRFDNRDTGLSHKCERGGLPDLAKAWQAYFSNRPITPPYSLKDMAGDIDGLLAFLGIQRAYVCGFSLGGMITQNMALAYPHRLAGIILMGSSTGSLTLPPPTSEARQAMIDPPPFDRDACIDHSVSVYRVFSGGSRYYDPDCRREAAAMAYDRGLYPQGFVRQSVAMLADGDRTERIRQIRVPALVIHGKTDTLSRPEHGRALADNIPGSGYALLPEWGHGLDYPGLWPTMVQHISDFCRSHQG